jgi:hypothetical protein
MQGGVGRDDRRIVGVAGTHKRPFLWRQLRQTADGSRLLHPPGRDLGRASE